jgi:hepatocyte growth factor-regulated tyrosine kinase substrate
MASKCFPHVEMLSEMHDKLSQIVKLYDKALTEHVSYQARRAVSPHLASATVAQQQPQVPYGNANDWTPQPSHVVPQLPMSPRAELSYMGGSQSQYQRSVDPKAQQGQPWVPQPQVVPQAQYSHPPPGIPPPKQQRSDPQVVHTQAYQYSATATTPVPVQSPPSQTPHAPPHILPPGSSYNVPSTPSQYTQSQISSPFSTHSLTPSNQIPPPQQSTPSQPPQTMSPIVPPVSQPPPQTTSNVQHLQPPTIKSHALSRHSTIASAPLAVTNHDFPARHNTISHAPSSHPHRSLPQQQQPVLPNFPVVPTTVPQSINMYAPSIPSVEQGEKKEALLIDL